ncbi:metal-dependent hydrolase [Longimicrobium sp.]|uniref:metal-dependent hydrolase n=1 Tax=Longimicrobium sp. TaxID=2029185 RepID=UPI003B3A4DAE
MAFPPAHMLIGAGFAELARSQMDRPPPRRYAWAVAGVLAASPDGDIILGILLGRGGSLHGTFTHSLTAAAVVALLAWAAGGARWAAIAGIGYASHLFVDLLDESGPTNLMLGWPFTGARPYSLGKLFPKVEVKGEGLVDTALNVLRPEQLVNLAIQTLMAAAIFAALVLLSRGGRGMRGQGRR